jgi:hypothetical protein
MTFNPGFMYMVSFRWVVIRYTGQGIECATIGVNNFIIPSSNNMTMSPWNQGFAGRIMEIMKGFTRICCNLTYLPLI